MLRSLTLENWKSFGTSRNVLEFAPLTLLVGPNASGKSNALDALRFLQGCALDFPLSDVLRGRYEGQREVWPAIRGGIVEAARSGTEGFTLATKWESGDDDDLVSIDVLTHRVRASCAGDVFVEEERLEENGAYLFDTHAPSLKGATGRGAGGALRTALRASGKGNSPTETYESHRLVLGQAEPGGRVAHAVIEAARRLRGWLREATFLDIRPSLMRDLKPENGGHLGASGENISSVLYSLRESNQLEDIVGWLQELCDADITGIEFDRTDRLREVMLLLVEKGGRRISARSASDGTLRFLGEVVALLTSPKGSLVVLEEPDVGLHPSRIRLLAELLEYVTRERGVQVLATTHSPTLLAQLSRGSLGSVVAFGRDPGSGDTVCARLGTLPYFETLRDAPNIEHLVSTGWLERAL
jgi:predicted ATPase